MENNTEKLFKQIYDKFSRMTAAIAFRYMGNIEDAEDITQEVFIKFYEFGMEKFDHPSKIKAWLALTTCNQCRNIILERKRKIKGIEKVPLILDEVDTNTIEAEIIYNEVLISLNNELNRLPEGTRRIYSEWLQLTKYKTSKQKMNEICAKYNITISTFWSHWQKGTNMIKKNLGLKHNNLLLKSNRYR